MKITITVMVQGKPFPQTIPLIPRGGNPLVQARDYERLHNVKLLNVTTENGNKVRNYNMRVVV